MSQVAGPYGLRIVKMQGDTPFSGGMQSYRLTAGANGAMFFGDPVGLLAGQPVTIAASPTSTPGPTSPIGIFMGCSYQDPAFGFVNRQYLPANAIAAGYTNIVIKVFDSPYGIMQVQANGPVTVDKIGMNAALIPGTGSTATGDSTWAMSAATAVTAGLAVRIYGFPYTPAPSPGVSSQPGDPFTDVLVMWTFGVHRLQQGLGQ
jgi:hypothetical protein